MREETSASAYNGRGDCGDVNSGEENKNRKIDKLQIGISSFFKKRFLKQEDSQHSGDNPSARAN